MKILAVPTLSDLVTVVTLNFLRGRAYTLKAWSYFQEGAVLRPQILIPECSVMSLHSDSGRRLSWRYRLDHHPALSLGTGEASVPS